MTRTPVRGLRHRSLSILSVFALAVAATVMGTPAASADSSPSVPTDPLTSPTVTADALPTVQIDGVVWKQVVIGNTVYAGGSFNTARPAGAAAGTETVERQNLLAYDIRTGDLITGFAPAFNAQVLSLAASPDGSRLYVGGDFTTLDGEAATRMVALDPSTGERIANFDPQPSNSVRAIVATNSTVYLGGSFFRLGTAWREEVAALRANDGALLAFRPVVGGGQVDSLALSPDGTKLAMGGKFQQVNSTAENANGLAIVDTTTSQKYAYPAASYIRNGGSTGSITSIASDSDTFYASGYTYGRESTLEGVVAIKWEDLETRWVEDCHGDTYSVHSAGDNIYVAGHPHYCGNVEGFAQEPDWAYNRAISFSKAIAGRISREIHGYTNYEGLPHPQLQTWFPSISAGTYTGQGQGPWNVTGNNDYIVYGGEFQRVNFKDQQGLVRFATKNNAPNLRGPSPTGTDFVPTLTSTTAGEVRIRWQTASDMDNRTLTYKVIRDGAINDPIHTATADSTFWARKGMSYVDKDVEPGSTHTYRIIVVDPTNRDARSTTESIQVADATVADTAYEKVIKADRPKTYWPIGSVDSGTVVDAVGSEDLVLSGNSSISTTNAITGGNGKSLNLGNGTAADAVRWKRPQEFSTELWFKASSTQRGRLIGYGNGLGVNSTDHDRVTYLNSSGRLSFGVTERGTKRVITSSSTYTDNKWHHVVSSLGAGGMRLYVDGEQVSSRSSTTSALELDGFWRLGKDSVSGWSSAPSSGFAGLLDEVAIYDTQLSAEKVLNHYQSGTGKPANVSPTAAFSHEVDGLKVTVDASGSSDPDGSIASYAWDFGDGQTSTEATANHTFADPGTYLIKLTVTDSAGATDSTSKSVVIPPPPAPNQAPTADFDISNIQGLKVTVDAEKSSDPDGDELTYRWSFGNGSDWIDGTNDQEFTYTEPGEYTITVEVSDPAGLTDTKAHSVTVSIPQGPVAADAFDRTVTGNWGAADVGGTWTRTSSSATANVAGGAGQLIGPNAGSGPGIYLPSTDSTSTVATVATRLDKKPTGGGTYVSFSPRYLNSANQYYLKSQFLATGDVRIQLVRAIAGSETVLVTKNLAGFGYQAGSEVKLKFSVTGTNPTQLSAKVWDAASVEPEEWQVNASDAASELQVAGGVGLRLYLSGSTANAPVTAEFDNLSVIGQ
ncbi:PKD domain-containing protein [Glutamicibacter sp. JC586]|uniref:PKD domain-containing protein n=1 Tax=Glutamicibacter sp. JC586 TaxID=2590552 RepID=UPI00135BC25F|nr:PKD domain-containing protein [Glutamicibacter sp. JC586]